MGHRLLLQPKLRHCPNEQADVGRNFMRSGLNMAFAVKLKSMRCAEDKENVENRENTQHSAQTR